MATRKPRTPRTPVSFNPDDYADVSHTDSPGLTADVEDVEDYEIRRARPRVNNDQGRGYVHGSTPDERRR